MIARGVKNIKTKGMWPVRGDVLNIKGGGRRWMEGSSQRVELEGKGRGFLI